MAGNADTQARIFVAIATAVDELADYDPTVKAVALEKLALAYRYAAGGTQPGASVIPS